MSFWLGLALLATGQHGASAEVKLTGHIIESIWVDFDKREARGACFDVVETSEWVEVTVC